MFVVENALAGEHASKVCKGMCVFACVCMFADIAEAVFRQISTRAVSIAKVCEARGNVCVHATAHCKGTSEMWCLNMCAHCVRCMTHINVCELTKFF